MKMLAWVVCASVCAGAFAAPTPGQSNDEFAMDYFKQFGYMGKGNPMFGEMTDAEAFPMAIKEFQAMNELEQTGVLDEPTMTLMNMPRCGDKDIDTMNDMTRRRKRRYALQGSSWMNRDITWKISQYTPDMSQQDVDKEVVRAFAVWSMVANINFRRVYSGRADIDISFVPQEHGDGNPFDGPGRTLAHAYYPQYGGDVHMDEAETWTIGTHSGINMFQVIAHEFGHSLGLAHSGIQAALMAPYYRGYQPDFMLHQDDITGIQAIYGRRTQTTTTRRPPTPPTLGPEPPVRTTRAPTTTTTTTTTTMPPVDPSMPRPCDDGRIDAAILLKSTRTTYMFRDDYYLVIDNYGIASGYPRKIADDWPGLPNNIDAALTRDEVYGYEYNYEQRRWSRTKYIDERIYFFKGSQVYRYTTDRVPVSGYPKSISQEFPGIPNDIDAVFVWGRNGKIYFFKGTQYYRYESGSIYQSGEGYDERPGYVTSRYPDSISVWQGVPTNLDAVFVWVNGRTYFFKDELYYRFHDRYLGVENGYPRDTRGAWFGCSSSNIEAGDDSTTMMMEGDMEGFPKFEMMDNERADSNSTDTTTDDDMTSGQSPVSFSLLSLLSLLFAMVMLQ